MTAPLADSPVELRPRNDNSVGLYVGGLFVANLRNPKTIASWVKRFEQADDPVEAAREHRRKVREQQEYRSWVGRTKKAVSAAFPGIVWEQSTTGSYYGWLGQDCLVRLSNHPPSQRGSWLVSIRDELLEPKAVVRIMLAARNNKENNDVR